MSEVFSFSFRYRVANKLGNAVYKGNSLRAAMSAASSHLTKVEEWSNEKRDWETFFSFDGSSYPSKKGYKLPSFQ